jgi:Arc/MetJ-type ribon-helix-helix transcriptional regulator
MASIEKILSVRISEQTVEEIDYLIHYAELKFHMELTKSDVIRQIIREAVNRIKSQEHYIKTLQTGEHR